MQSLPTREVAPALRRVPRVPAREDEAQLRRLQRVPAQAVAEDLRPMCGLSYAQEAEGGLLGLLPWPA